MHDVVYKNTQNTPLESDVTLVKVEDQITDGSKQTVANSYDISYGLKREFNLQLKHFIKYEILLEINKKEEQLILSNIENYISIKTGP